LVSLSLPLRDPGARSAKVGTGFASDRAPIFKERVILSQNRFTLSRITRERHRKGIFIGFPRGRVDIPQPAAVVADVCAGLRRMWELGFPNGRGRLTNS